MRNIVLPLLLLLNLSRQGFAQTIVWQEEVGHPRLTGAGFPSYFDQIGGMVPFENRFVVAIDGYVYDNPLAQQRITYLRYYDYEGNQFGGEDAIGGMVAATTLRRASDTSFLALTVYDYISASDIRYDTGQNGGYAVREYSIATGRLLWHKRFRQNSSSSVDGFYPRKGGGFTLDVSVNMDSRGPDSLAYEFYGRGGVLSHTGDFPYRFDCSDAVSTFEPERYVFVRRQRLGNPGPVLTTVEHIDSAMRTRRVDTIGLLPREYFNERIFPYPDGRYTVLIRQQSDTIRSRLYIFDRPGRPSRALRQDSVVMNFVPMADGGALRLISYFVSNSWQVIDALESAGQPSYRASYIQRLDPNLQPAWRLDITSQRYDSIITSYRPLASIPGSPEDALFGGSRIYGLSVRSRYPGTFALFGRINGIGRLFDPTSTKGPREEAQQRTWQPFPNPATKQLYLPFEQAVSYRILSASGQQVAEGKASRRQAIEVSALAPGLYQVEVSRRGFRRFVKQ